MKYNCKRSIIYNTILAACSIGCAVSEFLEPNMTAHNILIASVFALIGIVSVVQAVTEYKKYRQDNKKAS